MFTPINQQTAKRIRARVRLLQRLSENHLQTLDMANAADEDGWLERVAEMEDEKLDQMRIYPQSAESREWQVYVRQAYEIINSVIDARENFDRENPDQVQQMQSVERRITMFRKGLESKRMQQSHYQAVIDNFDVALVTATAEKPLRYEDAKRFVALMSTPGTSVNKTRLM